MSHVNHPIGVEIHAVAVNREPAYSCWPVLDFACIHNKMAILRTHNKNVRNLVEYEGVELSGMRSYH